MDAEVADSHVFAGPHRESSDPGGSEVPALKTSDKCRSSSEVPSQRNMQLEGDEIDSESTSPSHSKASGTSSSTSAYATDKRHRTTMILLASYASAVTLACVYLIMATMQSKSHELESLPDIKPLDANEFQYIPENASLPPGHRLQLGQPGQFGHILVEPLRITQEPLEFVHFSGEQKQTRSKTSPVLKLWVRLTNLSENQLIAPLDRTLLFKRDFDEQESSFLANNFIHSSAVGSMPLLMYDHPLSSEWDIRDQKLGTVLKPGESMVTYLPSEPAITDQLDGPAFWRMHLRKGFNDATGNGVTTLVDVEFDASQIVEDSALASSS